MNSRRAPGYQDKRKFYFRNAYSADKLVFSRLCQKYPERYLSVFLSVVTFCHMFVFDTFGFFLMGMAVSTGRGEMFCCQTGSGGLY